MDSVPIFAVQISDIATLHALLQGTDVKYRLEIAGYQTASPPTKKAKVVAVTKEISAHDANVLMLMAQMELWRSRQ